MCPVALSTRDEVVAEAQGPLHHARRRFVDFMVPYRTEFGHVRRSREPPSSRIVYRVCIVCICSRYSTNKSISNVLEL